MSVAAALRGAGWGVSSERARTATAGLAAAVVSAAVAAAWLSPLNAYDPLTYVATTAAATSVATAGVLLVRSPGQGRTGATLLAAAAFWLVSWSNEWGVGALPLLSQVLGPCWYVLGSSALLRYPHRALQRRFECIFLLVMAAWAVGGSSVLVLLGRPEWYSFPPTVTWPTAPTDRALHRQAETVWFGGLAVLLVVLLALLVAKLWRARGLSRRETVPTAVATAAVAVAGIAYVAVHLLVVPSRVHDLALVVIAGAVVAIPVALLVTAAGRHAARAAVADLVVTLTGTPSVAAIRVALRTTLRDPSLELYFWLPAAERYVDEDDGVGPCPQDVPDDRWAVEFADREGQPLAMLVTDGALRRHRELVTAAVGAGVLALSNERLHHQVRAQLEEVRASRHRIVATAQEERRRIERDLHDGAQQSLLAISATLSAARLQVADRPEAAEVIGRAQDDVRRAVTDLRDLARGLHPAVLSDDGLVPAVERVAEGLGLPTTIRAAATRRPPAVEAALYFAATEALTNVVRHAGASHATVEVVEAGERVRLVVTDDGRGGARAENGTGLTGLRDRLRALDGELTVDERRDGGTVLVAELPCR